jgi:hypothetical protein
VTGEFYISAGQTFTLDLGNSLPRVLVSIRAAGLAAEHLGYGEPFEKLMQDAEVCFRSATDRQNAKQDLEKAEIPISNEEDFLFYWSIGFQDAVIMMMDSQDKLHRIAEYCMNNLDRVIPGDEIITACNL